MLEKSDATIHLSMMTQYSVIIVSYNCCHDLKQCLLSLEKYSESDHEIIVVDNNSVDNTLSMLKTFEKVRVIANSNNFGFSKACNQGAQIAQGQYLVFLNPDTLVTPGWLHKLSPYLEIQNVGAVGPTSDYVAGKQKAEFYGAHYPASESEIPTLSQALYEKNRGKGVRTKLLIGFCLMLKKDFFVELGGMDEELFLGNDDLDLSWRISERKKFLVVATDVFIHHKGQKSFSTEPSQKVGKLVEDSTNALYRKLVKYYGGESKVPSSLELWGMEWFKPTIKGDLHQENISTHVSHDLLRDVKALKKTSPLGILICALPNLSSQEQLEKTLDSIHAIEPQNIFLLNFSNSLHVPFFKGERLDPSPQHTESEALIKALKLMDCVNLCIIPAGMEFTPFCERQLNTYTHLKECLAVSVQGTDYPFQPILGPLSKIMERVNQQKINLGSLIELAHRYMENSPLLWEIPKKITPENVRKHSHSAPLSSKQNTQENQKLEDTFLDSFPLSLKKIIQESIQPGFCQMGQSECWDPRGNIIDPKNVDSLVYTIRPGNHPLRKTLSELREVFFNAKKIELLILPHQPQAHGPEEQMTQLSNELRSELWHGGFCIEKEQNYLGLNNKTQEFLGWQWSILPRSYQYNFSKKVSIIILGFNQLEYTKLCIESIQKNTKQDYELILIDNGSQDGTSDYFKSIEKAKVIINSENLGVAKGWNQGLRVSTGEYLCILNNDTIVPPFWLENMVRLVESSPTIGIVGPRSNNISGPQKVLTPELKNQKDILEFAQSFQRDNNLSAFEFPRITGFCMVYSRQVFKEVGFFDERYGKGNFEDDDYCLRTRYLGYRLLVANDSFVFHFGSVSFNSNNIDWRQQMSQNQEKFQMKWAKGREAIHDTYLEPPEKEVKFNQYIQEAWAAYGNQNFKVARDCFVKALEYNDQNSEIYNGLGILAFHEKNFEEGLTFLRKAQEISPHDTDISENIVDLLKSSCSPVQLAKCLNALLIDFRENPVYIRELNSLSPPVRGREAIWKEEIESLISEKKYPDAINLLEQLLLNGTNVAFAYNALGIIAFECKDAKTAYDHFSKSLSIQLFDEDVLINYFDAGITLQKNHEVYSLFEQVLSYPEGKKFHEVEHHFRQLKDMVNGGSWNPQLIIQAREKNIAGENLIREGIPSKAKPILEEILQNDPNNFRALNNLGLVAWYEGQLEYSWHYFLEALQIHAGFLDALINAFDAALKLQKIPEFKNHLDRFLLFSPQHPDALKIKDEIEKMGDHIYALKAFEEINPLQEQFMKAQIALQENKLDESTLLFLDILEKDNQFARAYNGLGIIAYYRQMYQEAAKLFFRAVELHPLDEDSLVNLWETSKLLNQELQVLPRLVAALEVDPCMESVANIVHGASGLGQNT